MSEYTTCARCGIKIMMPSELMERRRADHAMFWCPNGHSNFFPGKTNEEKRIERLERAIARTSKTLNKLYVERELLLSTLKDCPLQDCDWRSRKVIPRGDGMLRGRERVRADLVEHLVSVHNAESVTGVSVERMVSGEIPEQAMPNA